MAYQEQESKITILAPGVYTKTAINCCFHRRQIFRCNKLKEDQETKWKGSKARNIGGGFKLFYHGVDGKRNGVGVILKEEFSKSVVEVKRVSDRVMIVRVEVEGMMINVISAYAPQVGCKLEEKERFWSELDEVVDGVPRKERLVIGADFNGHVGEGNRGDEEVMETMAWSKRQEAELEVAELKVLRFSLGVTTMDKIRNQFIRGTAHVGCFGDKVREARLRWFGHVQRRDMNYIGRRMLKMEPPGRRKRGRPRRRFMDVVREDMQVVGVKEADVEDRVVWRRMVRCGDP
ncbi:hypothetical protein C0J45_20687 [Silurus meridionalis]|nr:hypothetical protein C0J45_20687 [Silurus meridionalis]